MRWVFMNGVKNGVTLIGRLNKYAGEAMDNVLSAADKIYNDLIDPVFANVANSYFGDASNLSKVSATIKSDPQKYAAVYRNIFTNEDAREVTGDDR